MLFRSVSQSRYRGVRIVRIIIDCGSVEAKHCGWVVRYNFEVQFVEFVFLVTEGDAGEPREHIRITRIDQLGYF